MDSVKFSIITPSFNQAAYLESLIESISSQDYPHFEHIVIDGGSTDGSVEIIKRNQHRLKYWVSEPDRGPVDAIRKGLAVASGTWLNWINADDLLLPHSLRTIAQIVNLVPQAEWISGARLSIDKDGLVGGVCCPWLNQRGAFFGCGEFFLPQDATFLNAALLKRTGVTLREDLRNIFDTVLHDELLKYARPVLTSSVLSAMRWHSGQLSQNQKNVVTESNSALDGDCVRSRPQRLFRRLSRTRFHDSVHACCELLVHCGVIGDAKNWPAVLFDYKQGGLRAANAAEAFSQRGSL